MAFPSGTVRVTADGVVGTSGKPIRLWTVSLISGAGGASTLILRNGTVVGDTAYEQIDGSAASKATTKTYEGGLLFPAGLYADVDANVGYATFAISVEA